MLMTISLGHVDEAFISCVRIAIAMVCNLPNMSQKRAAEHTTNEALKI